VSSITVYDATALAKGATLTEATPLDEAPFRRDVYAQSKITQEARFREAAEDGTFALFVARPGAVYGPDRLMNGHIGVGFGPVLFRIGADGEVPLCHIDTCATALVAAAGLRPRGAWEAINLVDDDRPSRTRFVAALRASGWPRAVIPLPRICLTAPRALLPDHPILPGLLRPAIEAARLKPLKYSNKRLHDRLEGVTMIAFEEGMRQAIKHSGRTAK